MSGELAFLEGGGETGRRMRAVDWLLTPLGPPQRWPRSLKTVVRIALDSRYAMWLAWGPELTFFCNDAYAPTLGLKQGWAIGAPAKRVWAEIWPDIGPRIDTVLTSGRATWDERLLLFLERSGVREETYHTFSYSPLPDDRGRIQGMLCVVTEDTERVIGARRTELLGDVAKALAPARTEGELFAALSRALQGHGHDLPFSVCYLRDGKAPPVEAGRSGEPVDSRDPPIGADAWPLERVLGDNDVVEVANPAVLGRLSRGPWDRAAAKALLLPIANPGESAPTGVFVAGLNPYRPFDEGYRRFLDLLVGQVSAALASVRAWETGRRRTEELAELDRAKTTFFSNVSHELRTPLTLMMGPTTAALAQRDGALRGEELELVHRNQQRLLRLVNSLLDFARIEAGRMQPSLETIDLARETAELASVFRSAIERAGMQLRVDCAPLPAPVAVDRAMWEKIVLNLLSNAFKYTFAGTITVCLRESDGWAELRVSDTGTGIPENELPRLFVRFHRVEGARGRTLEGTGIGLALVRELALLHEGSAEVESVEGRGTTVIVRLPMTRAAPMPGRSAGEAAPAAWHRQLGAELVDEALRWLPDADGTSEVERGGRDAHAVATSGWAAPDAPASSGGEEAPELVSRTAPSSSEVVLVADDNADMRRYLRRLLQPQWRVRTAADGMEALVAARRDPPDLVITDIMMPRLDGLGLLSALRSDTTTAGVPIIVLSARAGGEARLDGLRAGADDYLAKPFSGRELVARVDALLTLARIRRDALRREEKLRIALQEADRRKDEFLATLAHELRNPLAPIRGAAEILGSPTVGRDELERTREVLRRQTRHMARLLDDLLDVSRITRGRLQLRRESVTIGAVVDTAVEAADAMLPGSLAGLRVDVPEPGRPVHVDPVRVVQILTNLLNNAAKYSEPGRRIDLSARWEGGQLALVVGDEGIGMTSEQIGGAFDLFSQYPRSGGKADGGLGIGLALVRGIVALHGGTVAARSAGPGQGTEFVARLPAGSSAEDVDRPAPEREDATARQGRRVLVVDDNIDAAWMMAAFLRMAGHSTALAHSGQDALARAADFQPDVVLLDIGLPDVSGYEVARQLRAGHAMAALLVAVTGWGQPDDLQRARDAGFDHHLVKPADTDELLRLLARERRAVAAGSAGNAGMQ